MPREPIRRSRYRRRAAFSLLLSAAFAFVPCQGAAQDRCSATVTRGGRRFALQNCAVSYRESDHGMTIWFTETPLSPEETRFFQTSSLAPGRDTRLSAVRIRLGDLGYCNGNQDNACRRRGGVYPRPPPYGPPY